MPTSVQIIRRTCVYAPWLQPLAMHEPSTSKSRQDLQMLHILTQIFESFFWGGEETPADEKLFSWSSSTMARITNLPQLKCYTPQSLRASLPPERMDAWKTRSSFLLGVRYCHFSGDFAVKLWVCHSFWVEGELASPWFLFAESKVQPLSFSMVMALSWSQNTPGFERDDGLVKKRVPRWFHISFFLWGGRANTLKTLPASMGRSVFTDPWGVDFLWVFSCFFMLGKYTNPTDSMGSM